MKQTSNFLNLVMVGVLVLLALNTLQPQTTAAARSSQAPVELPSTQDDTCSADRTVNVSGAAVVYVTPDRALIQLGVQTNGVTPEETQGRNFLITQQVINSVRSQGVEAKDIATDYIIVMPIYEEYDALDIKGYRIDNTISITLRDVKLVEKVIVAALKAGANEVQDIQFYSSELRKYRDQAREMAMQAAVEKASALAGAAGAEAGCVLSISENTWTQYYGSWRSGRDLALWAQNAYTNADPSGGSQDEGDTPISLGQLAVRAEINASFSLR
jgi:uncharacterized protein YggE